MKILSDTFFSTLTPVIKKMNFKFELKSWARKWKCEKKKLSSEILELKSTKPNGSSDRKIWVEEIGIEKLSIRIPWIFIVNSFLFILILQHKILFFLNFKTMRDEPIAFEHGSTSRSEINLKTILDFHQSAFEKFYALNKSSWYSGIQNVQMIKSNDSAESSIFESNFFPFIFFIKFLLQMSLSNPQPRYPSKIFFLLIESCPKFMPFLFRFNYRRNLWVFWQCTLKQCYYG